MGDTYADRTPLGTLEGRVLHTDPPRRIAFEQQTASGRLRIRITYTLRPSPDGGTRIERTGIITTAGPLRALHGPVVTFTRRENRRTLSTLKAVLNERADAPPGQIEPCRSGGLRSY